MTLREYQDSLSDQDKEFGALGAYLSRYSLYNTMSMEKYHEEEVGSIHCNLKRNQEQKKDPLPTHLFGPHPNSPFRRGTLSDAL